MKKILSLLIMLSLLLSFGCSKDELAPNKPKIQWGQGDATEDEDSGDEGNTGNEGNEGGETPGGTETPGGNEQDENAPDVPAQLASTYPAGTDISGQGATLPAWSRGNLDIHFINTGTGECAFIIMPDGTQMLVDAASSDTNPSDKGDDGTNYYIPHKPDRSKRPSEWISKYISELKKWTGNSRMDYCCVSHFHLDHIGQRVDTDPAIALWGQAVPAGLVGESHVVFTAGRKNKMGKNGFTVEDLLEQGGGYQKIGIAELFDDHGVGLIVDKGYPNYDYPKPLAYSVADEEGVHREGYYGWSILNYRNSARYHELYRGTRREAFKVGSNSQLKLVKDPARYPNFEIRNLSSNGTIWTGTGESTSAKFPSNSQLKTSSSTNTTSPNENMTSTVFKVSYGKFDYFSGGDVTSNNVTSSNAWRDTEKFLANCTGEVDVFKANHHGSHDGCTDYFLGKTTPQVTVVNVFRRVQPRSETYDRLVKIPEMDIYTTNHIKAWTDSFANKGRRIVGPKGGHVVVRVSPGGDEFYVYYLDDTDKNMSMKVTWYQKYQSRD